jgi:DNA-binding XRE family transcriptional regulator
MLRWQSKIRNPGDPKTLGQQISDHKREMCLTTAQLASLVGCSRQTIDNVEGGKNSAGVELVAAIARALKCRLITEGDRITLEKLTAQEIRRLRL